MHRCRSTRHRREVNHWARMCSVNPNGKSMSQRMHYQTLSDGTASWFTSLGGPNAQSVKVGVQNKWNGIYRWILNLSAVQRRQSSDFVIRNVWDEHRFNAGSVICTWIKRNLLISYSIKSYLICYYGNQYCETISLYIIIIIMCNH